MIRSACQSVHNVVAAVNSVDENGDGVESRTNLARKQLDDGICIGQTDFLLNITKGQMLLVSQASHGQDACDMYPFVSGEFKPVETYSKR